MQSGNHSIKESNMQWNSLQRVAAAAFLLAGCGFAQAQTPAAPGSKPQAATTAPSTAAQAPAAQTPATPDATKAKGQQRDRTAAVSNRFAAADANHDGKLTLDEARAGMPRIATNFDKIDKQKKGYITLDEIISYNQDRTGQAAPAAPASAPAAAPAPAPAKKAK
jgi:hypothetical protein